MQITIPMEITDAEVLSTNMTEDNALDAWSSGTTYAVGDSVYVFSTHRIYKSLVASNLGNDPTTDGGTNWLDYGWTNKYRAIKQDTASPTIADDDESTIRYNVQTTKDCTEVAVMGVKAQTVRVTVKNTSSVLVHDETQNAVETIDGLEWYVGKLIFRDLPADTGFEVRVIVSATGRSDPAEIALLIIGNSYSLGTVIEGRTQVGFDDFSIKEQDSSSAFTITERGYSDAISFEFWHDILATRWVQDILATYRNTPCLFWDDQPDLSMGLFTFGYGEEPVTNQRIGDTRTEMTVAALAFGTPGAVTNIAGGGGEVITAATPSGYVYVVATLAADTAVPHGTAIVWDTRVDTNGGWAWTDPDSEFTVPTGVNTAIVNCSLRSYTAVGQDTDLEIQLNGTTVAFHTADNQIYPVSEVYVILDVTAGDTIKAVVTTGVSASTALAGGSDYSFMSIEGFSL